MTSSSPRTCRLRLASLLLLSLAVACSGGGSPPASTLTALAAVAAAFPGSGAGWNDYVRGSSIATASDTPCAAATDTACVHGGEARLAIVTGRASCTGLTASDALGAFDWTCDASTGTARMISTGLQRGRYLSDLIDFTSLQWKPNSVTISDGGAAFAATPSSRWWSNPIAAANGGGSLASAGTVYAVTADVTGTYTLDASRVALVSQPGVTITGPGGDFIRVVSANGQDFLWIEGAVDAQGNDVCISWNFVRFSALRNVVAKNASTVNQRALLIYGATNSQLTDIVAANNGETGIWLNACSRNRLTNLRSFNNGFYGLDLDTCTDNVFEDVVATGNASHGILANSISNNVFSRVFTGNTGAGASSGSGIGLYSSNGNLLTSVANTNSGAPGIALAFSSNNTLSDVASDGGSYGVSLSDASHNAFTGCLKVNSQRCQVSGGTEPGLVNGTCTTTGAAGSSTYGVGDTSDAVLTPGITLAASAVGGITTDDPANGSDDGGAAAAYPADPSQFDWSSFRTAFRTWGKDGTPGTLDSRGRWTSGAGRIWDWSLRGTDTVLRAALAVPTGDDTLTHTWSDASTVTFLRKAVELAGNGNGLCESGERCLYTPNVGAYQGHGPLISAGPFTDGALTGITLLRYQSDGS